MTRLVPGEPLPPYSYVPGRQPHPESDPAGHRFGHGDREPVRFEPGNWATSSDYLFGCDLFNHGYYWEAHEAWEAAWLGCGRTGTAATFLKGLIKLAAAAVKAREGRPDGTKRHALRSAELLREVRGEAGQPRYLGLEVDHLIRFADSVPASEFSWAATNDAVLVVFDLVLLPTSRRGEGPATDG